MQAIRLVSCALVVCALSAQPARRSLTLDDLPRMRDVSDPQCSPDGQAVAYVVSTIDVKEDKRQSHIWITGFDGRNDRQMTFSQDSESAPRFSPDGRYLSFTSSRPGKAKGNQVWLLDRRGGEALQLTEVEGRLQGYVWSPDSKRLALLVGDKDPDADPPEPSPAATPAKPKTPKPIVIDRYKFKQDIQGYLLSGRHTYVYLFDIAARKAERLTTQKQWDESSPSFSPDGSRIVFISNHSTDPDRDPHGQLFVAEAKAGVAEKMVAKSARGERGARLEWSSDGKWIAFLDGDEKQFGAYNMDHLNTVASDGSAAPKRVTATEALDRGVSSPRFGADGRSITVLVTDDRSVYPVRASLTDGGVEPLLPKPVVIQSPTSEKACHAVLSGGTRRPAEVFAVEGRTLRQITHQNDALFAELETGVTEEVSFKSKDGTEVHGLLTKPVNHTSGRVPLLLRIHGGPNGQDQHTFSMETQIFAANGYAVLAVNYRGSAGRGKKFSRAIFADWGHYEVEDLLAAVDHAIATGIADPDRLGVGGWSYGGILTDYLIATDNRFKAAVSGAGTAFTVSFYGTDQYILQYDHEIGPPWNPQAWETYVKLSYPFLHADRIKTPTLFLGGERDFNVPVEGSQQMYQALRSLGIDTQLVIYPNEFHGIQRPSYVKDRYERYLNWYAKYLRKPTSTTLSAGAQD